MSRKYFKHSKSRSKSNWIKNIFDLIRNKFFKKKTQQQEEKNPNAEYIALKNIFEGKPANFLDISDPDFVTRPTYSTNTIGGDYYTPKLTPKGLEALKRWNEAK